MNRHKWGLNICCGKTDGGGVNADIVNHKTLPNFVLVENIYQLPFNDDQFDSVLCSHTLEHVEDPLKFYQELKRVGKNVTIVVPPLWDVSAAFNIIEHKWIFLTLKSEHTGVPKFTRLFFAKYIHKKLGQIIKA